MVEFPGRTMPEGSPQRANIKAEEAAAGEDSTTGIMDLGVEAGADSIEMIIGVEVGEVSAEEEEEASGEVIVEASAGEEEEEVIVEDSEEETGVETGVETEVEIAVVSGEGVVATEL